MSVQAYSPDEIAEREELTSLSTERYLSGLAAVGLIERDVGTSATCEQCGLRRGKCHKSEAGVLQRRCQGERDENGNEID